MIAKLFKIIFVILLLVVLGELGYYLVTLNKGEVRTKPTTTQRPKDALVTQEVLDFIGALKKSPNQKFHLRTETTGFIEGVSETTGGEAYILKIVNNKGKKVMNYVLDKQIKNDNAFYLVENDKKTKITINDLKINDKITVNDEHEIRDNIINVDFFIYR